MNQHLYKKLEQEATIIQLKIFDVKADGNCFYHSVSHMLWYNYKDKETGPKIRERLVEYIISNYQKYKDRFESVYIRDSFENYLLQLSNLEWADHFAITATAEMLDITIKILKDEGNWLIINGNKMREIKIGHIAELHYVALQKIESIGYQTRSKSAKKQKLTVPLEFFF